ncbi:hydrolase [Vagococcus xieshaowenii]|uniref:Hydrolase n=1 Tax=Vagococcus xieshaowenii TaxID=2562451 RepID=A0AAJ5EF01_9ENTE|nr:hydrolase [Vagococcus xieshaowenii]QCA29327.1 hydrolase [Vagococcus xieshaowenii]TFZ41978.1 hydrolase [Vagococcus xieshaowenii]
MKPNEIPEIMTPLRQDIIKLPEVIRQCSGIKIFGKKIKSIIYTTDIAIIRNTDADAVIAVYPFTPHPTITRSITEAADIPVFCGVGGGTTQGPRSAQMSLFAESQGAIGVVVNAPTPRETIEAINETIDIPIVATVTSIYTDIEEKLNAGAMILNVSGGKDTADVVRTIRERYPNVPIIATGGPTEEGILKTIEAGANAITYTPPSNGELFSKKMDKYRLIEKEAAEVNDK